MKHLFTFLIAILFTSLGFGQTTVDFDNLANWNPGSTSYGNYTYTDGTFTATGVDVLRNGTATQDGFSGALGTYSVRLRNNSSTSLTMIVATGGISTFSFEVRRWDGSPATNFSVEITTDNGSSWTPSSTIDATVTDNSDWKTINGSINSGNSNVGVRIVSNGTTERLMVDNFTWTAFSASTPTVGFDSVSSTENETNTTFNVNIPVTLSNYSTNVDLSVSVNGSSTAEGGDYTLNTTTLNFTADGTLNISLDINADADSDDETIIIDIAETSATGVTITTSQHTVTVIDDDLPSASIPYNEDFADCGIQEWTVATVGAELEWTCGSGYFEANAFGSSGAADDYLISPSFDMDAQTGETLSFNSSTSFADVTSPQIELLYTTNYTGDPSTTTWVDTLSPTWPGNDSSGNSGNIDISGISGTAVHFAFRYTSTGTGGGSTEAWRIEDFDITTASTPSITLSETSLSGFDYADGSGPSAEQTFTAEGNNLTADITITAPTDFEVSTTSGIGFGPSVTLTETAGTVTTTTIYVRLASGLTVNTYSGTLSATSTGAVQQDISLSGEVTFVSCAGTSTTFPFTGVSGSTNLEHSSSNPPGSSGEDCGTNYLIYYDSTPSTDGSGNYIRSNAVDGLIEAADWGGVGKFETFAIDVSGETSIDIETFGSTVGTPFNAGGEQFQWWYKLDGGAEINLGSVFDSNYQGSLAVGPTTIDVTSVNEIIVGFTFNFNGGSDGFEDADVTVTTTPTVFTFNGSWSPSDPNGSATANDNIVVESGNAIISSNTDINTVTIDAGASLTINTGVTLTATATTLESTSTSYSSLILDGSLTGTVSYNRYVNTNDAVNGNDLISAPLSGQAFDVFIGNNTNILANPSGPEVLFGGFDNDNASAPYELWNDTDTTPLTAGIGYRSGIEVGAPTNLVSFEGTVNNSLVEVAIDQGSASILNLVGNPFPSYLDAQAFLTQNTALLDPSAVVIYGYNDSTNGTSADDYTIISAIENNTLNIAPGQGFFVASNLVGGNLQFTTSTPDMRITSTDDDFIAGRTTSSAITNVNINLSNATDNFITKVYFTASSGLGLDPGYDASLLGGVAPAFSLFSHLVEENMGVPFATQAIGETDYNDTTIALGVNANMGEQLTFSIAESTLPASIEVYLDDTLTSTSTLLNTSDYVLTPSTNLSGTGRFYLRFTNSALSTTDNVFESISIYANQSNKTITIAGLLGEGTSANVYDIQGRLVTSKALESNATLQTIDASNLYTGVYIVKLSNGTSVKTEKIILK